MIACITRLLNTVIFFYCKSINITEPPVFHRKNNEICYRNISVKISCTLNKNTNLLADTCSDSTIIILG